MPLLRKAGIRSPWLPSPLQGNVDPLRQTIVIGAIVPALLLGGNTQFVGRLSRPEDVAWPARPAIVQTPPVPVPGASVWMPSAARLPNTDPLRPPILVADQPDATLAQPNTTFIGRLPRNEDTTRPARPAVVVGVGVPVPGAVVVVGYAPRDIGVPPPDRLALTQLIAGQTPVPGALTQFIGRITETPLLRLARTLVQGQPVPVPGAQTWMPALRSASAIPPDPVVHNQTQAPISATFATLAPISASFTTQATITAKFVMLAPLAAGGGQQSAILATGGQTSAPPGTDGRTSAPIIP